MNRKAAKQAKGHMHSCKGDDGAPCPTGARVRCTGILLHTERCPACQEKTTDRVLFGPRSVYF